MNCKECLHFPICALSANPDEVACDYFYANQKTGHWDDSCPVVSDGSLWKSWVCSKCDNRVMVKTPYCCRCGSKMEG